MIAELVPAVAKTSLLTSLLIGPLLLLVPLLQRRYRTKWRYTVWLLLALRLLIPLEMPLPGPFIRVPLPERSAVQTATAPALEAPAPAMAAPVPGPNIPVVESRAGSPDARTLPLLAGGVWLAGAVLFLLVQLCSYRLFLSRLRRSGPQAAPGQICEQVRRLGAEMGIRRPPVPVIAAVVDAPVLLGMTAPKILLPHARYSQEEMEFILRHELVHYRRGDIWYKLLLLLANAVHWFNPLVYLMAAQAARDIELTCDEAVVRGLSREERAGYGNTILSALPRKRRLEPMFSTHFGSAKKNAKSRLRNLFDTSAKRRGGTLLCAVALCALTVTGTVTFVSAAPQTETVDAIGEGHVISIPRIEAGELVCVGRVEVEPGFSLQGSIAAQSGGGLFAAQSKEAGLTHIPEEKWWSRHFGMNGDGTVQFFLSGLRKEETATYYLYVGSDGAAASDVYGSISANGAPITRANLTMGGIDGRVVSASPGVDVQTGAEPFSATRLGRHDLQRGDRVGVNLRWNGKGSVMLLYTDVDYSLEEVLLPLQGLSGVPKPDYDKIDADKMGSVFNFNRSSDSPITWEHPETAEAGAYYFYLLRFDYADGVEGSVTTTNAQGVTATIWEA